MLVAMPDGSRWAVPIDLIARNRAECYADEYGGDVERSLAEDTLPLFASDTFEISDWAQNNMNWSEVSASAECRHPPECDYEKGWANGETDFD